MDTQYYSFQPKIILVWWRRTLEGVILARRLISFRKLEFRWRDGHCLNAKCYSNIYNVRKQKVLYAIWNTNNKISSFFWKYMFVEGSCRILIYRGMLKSHQSCHSKIRKLFCWRIRSWSVRPNLEPLQKYTHIHTHSGRHAHSHTQIHFPL